MDALLQPVWDSLFLPFAEFAFMRRALVATLALALEREDMGAEVRAMAQRLLAG